MAAERRIGLGSAAILVVANMIGAGVFTTSGLALADLGRREPVLLAWGLGGLLAMCGTLSYGALARRMPESGGEYMFLSRTVHPLAGFLAGWVSLLAGFTAPIAASAIGLQAYLADSFGVTDDPTPLRLSAFAVTLVWISFAYSGWNAAVYVAGEVRDPERNLHRALWLGTALVTVIYLALNAVFLYAADAAKLAGKIEVGAIAAEALGGPGLRRVVSALVALALFTSISSMVMAGARGDGRPGGEGLPPRLFAGGGGGG